jgi:hypothetical protein
VSALGICSVLIKDNHTDQKGNPDDNESTHRLCLKEQQRSDKRRPKVIHAATATGAAVVSYEC